MEMEKQTLGEQLSTGPSLTKGHREDWDQTGLAWFLPVSHTHFILKLEA